MEWAPSGVGLEIQSQKGLCLSSCGREVMELRRVALALRAGFLYSIVRGRGCGGLIGGRATIKVGRGSRFKRSRRPTSSSFEVILALSDDVDYETAGDLCRRSMRRSIRLAEVTMLEADGNERSANECQ